MLIKLVLATNLFFMRQYFLTIPRDFEEAAKLDNAGHFKTFWKVMLPLTGPALAAITILTFQGIWNEFFWPLILLGFGEPGPLHRPARDRAVQLPVPDALAAADGRERDRDPADRRHLPLLPAVLRLRCRLRAGSRDDRQGALRYALRDMYEQSWRLALLNTALLAVVLAVARAGELRADRARARHRRRPARRWRLMHCAVSPSGTTTFGLRPLSRACGCTGFVGSSSARWRASSSLPGSLAVRSYGSSGAFDVAARVRRRLSASALFLVFQLAALAARGRRARTATATPARGRRQRCSPGGRPRRSGSRSRCC